MTSKDIRRMSEEELPDIDYFLNKLTLMTILEKNFFTSFKSQTIYFLFISYQNDKFFIFKYNTKDPNDLSLRSI